MESGKKEKEPEFVSTEDMEAIEERIRQAAKEEDAEGTGDT